MKPQRGDIITIVVPLFPGSRQMVIHTAVVKKSAESIRCAYRDYTIRRGDMFLGTATHTVRHTYSVHRRTEGRTWACGTTGPEVDALRVTAALL